MLNKLRDIFAKTFASEPKEKPQKKTRKPRQKKVKEEAPKLTEKELATQRGEPWVKVIEFEMDPQDMHTGNFSIDYNDKFVLNLIRAGYKQKETDTDHEIVDRWFTDVCRSVVLEHHQQLMADPDTRARSDLRIIRSRNLGDGRSEIS